MNCIIPGRGIRAFGKAIYCLAKIGEELYIEALPDGLALKTVNGARSAFASFIFQRSFFHSYRAVRRVPGRDLEDDDGDEEPLKCKISIKSCVSVFKALSTLEKTVDRCSFYLDSQQNKLVFVFHCRHGIVKTHNLGFQECEALQAVFTKDLCPNQIIGPAKIVSEVVVNFPNNLDEVTLIAEPESVRLKNYVEEDDSDRVSLTEISLAPQEFDDYQIGVDVSITFCLKELRALLVFTDAINQSLSIRFEGPGRPVVFSLDDCNDYQADFVLATLLDGTSPSQTSTSAGATSAMDTQPSSAEPHRRQPHKRTHNGHQRTLNSTNSPDIDQGDLEESVSIEQSHSTLQPTCGRAASEGKAIARGTVPYKRAREFTSPDFPSGSQFGNAGEGSSKSLKLSHKSPAAAHVPPPPMDTDFMDIDPSLPRTSSVRRPTSSNNSNRDKSLRITASTTTEELMDALFGAENNTDVAEDERVFSKKREHSDSARQAAKHQTDDTQYDKETVTSGVAALPDREHDVHMFPDDFPFEDNTTSKVQPLSTSAKVTLSDEHSTQDSIINDSGFLPSTPPSKKFKRGSVLFEVDLFGDRQRRAEVLAPDSEEDSD